MKRLDDDFPIIKTTSLKKQNDAHPLRPAGYSPACDARGVHCYTAYLDGKVAGEYIVGAEDLPREYELNLNHALTMKITGISWLHYCGMADITIE